MRKLYKIYLTEKENRDVKVYVRAVMFGGEPFIQIMPAFSEKSIGIFEEDKAKKYIELLNEQNANIGLEFCIEEVSQ